MEPGIQGAAYAKNLKLPILANAFQSKLPLFAGNFVLIRIFCSMLTIPLSLMKWVLTFGENSMPIELESGRLQLTDDEIFLYAPAAALIAQTDREYLPLHEPMTQTQFVKLCLAYCVVVGDTQILDDVMAVAEAEIARRRYKH